MHLGCERAVWKSSSHKLAQPNVSLNAFTLLLSSASPLDNATLDCVLLQNAMGTPPNKTTPPLHDLRSMASLAQSLSQYAEIEIWGSISA